MSGKISRRRYLKYIGAGLTVTAGAVAGAYYYPRPETAPARTETLTPTATATSTTAATPISTSTQTSATLAESQTSMIYSRQEMPDFWKGIMFVQWYSEHASSIEPGMRELKKRVPANGVSLWVPYYTETPTSDKIQPIYNTSEYGTPWYGEQLVESWPTELIEKTVDLTHQLGLRVAYWPCVGPVTYGLAWENGLDPTPAVFKAYREFKADQAIFAEKHKCESLWLGNEWNRSFEYGEAWKSILEEVSTNFSGAIVVEFLFNEPYNWDKVTGTFDPDAFKLTNYLGLSMITIPMSPNYQGVETYSPINYGPTVAEIVARWKEPVAAIGKACARFNKPAIITELAAFSFDGAASMDWRYHGKLTDFPVDFQEQADQIEGVMRALTPLECVRGVSWNFWDAYEPGLCYPMDPYGERAEIFQGKPAEKVLRYWYSKKNIKDGVGLLLTPDGHVDLENLQRQNPLNEYGKTD